MLARGLLLLTTTAVLTAGGGGLPAVTARAQVIDFSDIHKFESMGSGTQHGGAPPKIIADDAGPHLVLITVVEANADARITWRSLEDGSPRTTMIHGPGVQAFKTAGELRLETLGDDSRSVKYGYLLFELKK